MKKSLITLAVLAAATNVASAQSSVTIYGLVDAGVVSEHGGKNGSVQKIGSGVGSYSRLGFKGNEDLGNGLSAVFVLEAGFKVDDGTQDTAGSLFQRQAYVGLKSKDLGTLTLGRQYTPYYLTISTVADPFAVGYAGSAKNLLPTAGSLTRTPNTINYTSPSLAGFTGEAAYSTGEQADDNLAGRQWGAAVAYKNGPLNVRAAYNTRNQDVAPTLSPVNGGSGTGNSKNSIIAANYDFGVVKAFASFGANKGNVSSPYPTGAAYTTVAVLPSADSRDYLIGATVPLGNGSLMASGIHKDDRESFNRDANQFAIGYSYNLSQRTSAYVAAAKIKNKNGASYTVGNNTDAGTGDRAYNIGVRHSF